MLVDLNETDLSNIERWFCIADRESYSGIEDEPTLLKIGMNDLADSVRGFHEYKKGSGALGVNI